MNALLRFCAVALCIITATTTTFSQGPPPCPESPNLPQFPYSQGGCYITTVEAGGAYCQTEICYCYRTWDFFGLVVIDYYVTRVRILDPGCRAVTVREFIEAAGIQLLRDNPQNFPCPSCPDYTLEWHITKRSCWRSTIDPITGEEILEHCNASGYCTDTYSVCCPVPGYKIIDHVSQATDPSPCPFECFVMCE